VDAINLLANIALPTSFGAPAAPLQPGQVVQALVLELLQSNVFRLRLPQAVLDIRTNVPLTPGSTVTLAVKGTGSAVRLDILAQTNAPAARAQTSRAPAVPDSAAGVQTPRRPIGEAIIIGRINLPEAPSAPAPAAAVAPSPPDITPSRALAEAVRAAAARQGGLAPLFADVEQAARIATLPEAVRAAATQLLGFRVPLDEGLTAADVKQALTRSGVLLEPRLGAAIKSAASTPTAPTTQPASSPDDLKATLLVLRQALKTWLGAAPQTIPTASLTTPEPPAGPPASASPPLSPQDAESIAKSVSALLTKVATASSVANVSANPPPPYRGAPLTPQPPAPAAILDTASPRAAGARLLVETDAALARLTLLQAASLPDASLDAPQVAGPRWTLEVPFATAQGTGIVPFEIARDGRAASCEPQAAAWRARFSLDLEPMGPVHALVTLAGDRASVTLWAERHATAAQLNDNARMLGDALRAAELQPSELSFRVGTPRAAKAAAPGRFMDRAS
jgi:flagellar hook-length control protein FliK